MCYIIGSESTAAFGAGQRPTASAVGFFIGEPMETNYDKPFKTFEEQIDILKSRNLIIRLSGHFVLFFVAMKLDNY